MLEVLLTVGTGSDPRSIVIEEYRNTFGRGSDAAFQFDDHGLSRLNSTIYRDGDRIWIVDENSTNGTLINGSPADAAGTPLRDGDTIKIGNSTTIAVSIKDPAKAQPAASVSSVAASTVPQDRQFGLLPIALIGFAALIILASVGLIAVVVFGGESRQLVINDDPMITDRGTTEPSSTPASGKTPKPGESPTPEELPKNDNSTPALPPGKKYAELTDAEKRDYVADKAMKVAQIIGNSASDKIPEAALSKIKADVDAYASRSRVKPFTGDRCRTGDNLQATYERASKNAPFILKAFNATGTDARIGLYLAMIESEHCPCLQSGTGPLGMFQFTQATGRLHGLDTKPGASPSNPDERCEPEPAARAAASYMKSLTGRFGTGPSSVPLAIGSYNSGEGGLSSNLVKALSSGEGLPRDFWTLIANGDKLSKQFQAENFKYVPKFFAAAIIGENPQDFGLNLQPLSTYSK